MKRAIGVVCGMVLGAAVAGAQSQVTKFEVAGVPVILKPISANEVIAVRMYLRGGAASLTPANAGIEAMMLAASTQGTSKYSKDAFTELSTETGTNIGSQATMDYSVLTMQGVRQNWDKSWDLFTQAARWGCARPNPKPGAVHWKPSPKARTV